jgi:hypothetical protein
MKKTFSFLLIVVSLFVGYKIIDKKIKKRVINMSVFKLPQLLEDNLSYFYSENGHYPDNIDLDNFYDLTSLSNDEINSLQKKMIVDTYSKSGQFLYYVKIEKITGKCCGYILLSSGIDGKIDNRLAVIDCKKNLNEGLLLYSSEDFNVFDYFFGKKDLVYSYENKCDCNLKTDSNLYIVPIRWLDY